ncbi:MAG: hypothetical protein DRN90_00225 [Thermoproteota archaeon]|nr:MAG: hypothetical protein DRN90_00225 [Candidatus Korarchaeota archaeon]
MWVRFLKYLQKIVEGRFKVGRGHGGGAIFQYNPDTGEFERTKFPVEWSRSGRGWTGEALVKVPEGTLLKYVKFEVPNPTTHYYIATSEGFKEVGYDTILKEIAKVDGSTVIAKCRQLKDLGVDDCYLYYVKGFFSDFFTPEYRGSKRRIENWVKALEMLRDIEKKIKSRVKELTGVEPVKLVRGGSHIMEALRPDHISKASICVKFPYLGTDKFKELARKFRYNYAYSCFEIPASALGEDLAKEIAETIYLRAGRYIRG